MNYTPDPWHFPQVVHSPDGKYALKYSNLHEIGMGAPLSGECYLIAGGAEYKISDWAAGPALWNDAGDKVALPVWSVDNSQQVAIIDVKAMTLTIYTKGFGILWLQQFGNLITAIHSPVVSSEVVQFNIETEDVLAIIFMNK